MLKRNNRKIIIPNSEILNKDYLLTELVKKITRKLKLKPKFYKKGNYTKNYKNKICYISLTSISDGQKSSEEFFSNKENISKDRDGSICKVDLPTYNNKVNFILNRILNSNDVEKLKNIYQKNSKIINFRKNILK